MCGRERYVVNESMSHGRQPLVGDVPEIVLLVVMMLRCGLQATTDGQQHGDDAKRRQVAEQHGEAVGQPQDGVAQLVVLCGRANDWNWRLVLI